ncbi:GPP34 family phosphoprotein [Actinoplanes sp. NPDC020271]|uniref:GOLPH3/VPS74 family protein n=1 Tax=Actinoplanes sp. NPDC020271 TaxID=3363896 RepID=UPI0037A2EF5B
MEQWPKFADDLFRLAHDREQLFVDRHLAAVGLACAVLAELGVADRVAVERDRLVVIDQRPPPDALAHTVLEKVASEPDPLTPQDWMRYLSEDIYDQVAQRMIQSGDLRKVTKHGRLFGRSRTVYEPTDNNRAYWPTARLNTSVQRGRDFDAFDRVLVGLCLSSGVYQKVFTEAPRYVVDQLIATSHQSRPPVPALLSALDSLGGTTILIHP